MKEVYSENPSGRIKGMGKIIFLILLIGGLIYLKFASEVSIFEEFQYLIEDIGQSIEESFDEEYYYYDDDTDLELDNPLKDYLVKEGIITTRFENYYHGIMTETEDFTHKNITYTVNYNEELGMVTISNASNYNEYFSYSNSDYEWDTITVSAFDYGFLIEIVHKDSDYNTYLFLTDELVGKLELETEVEYAPQLGDDKYIYFGYDDGPGVDIYKYIPITGSYYIVRYA